MKKSLHISIVICSIIMGLLSCRDDHDDGLTELTADFEMSEHQGLTTTIFNFDVGGAVDLGDNKNPVFVRFDWEADGTWDIMHSTLPSYEHRYFQKGNYDIILEVSRLSGEKDTIQKTVIVDQGYSPPQVVFFTYPDSSNLLTEFIFDGSFTHDDEDSIETLLFRWDFDGDEIWDTDFQSNPITTHTYNISDYYTAVMEVKDTMNLIGRAATEVIVNRYTHLIKPILNYSCGFCTVEEEFIFDASESYEEGKPESKLLYSFDTNFDGKWEVEESENPIYRCFLENNKIYNVTLRVTAPNGLIMDTLVKVEVHPANTPPYASLTVGCKVGNPSTQFHFHSRRSWDRDESIMNLRIRWDLDNNGEWDSELDDLMDVYRNYPETGEHIVQMLIIDSGDKETLCIDTIMVYEGNHVTDLLLDKRPVFDEEYGIVKIGTQWWMQENYNSEFESKDFAIAGTCYKGDEDNCDKYGKLYSFGVMRNPEICPKGWRVPKMNDWEILMEYLEDNHVGKLLMGGSSEFHIGLGGYIDHSGKFTGIEESTHFWARDLSRAGVPMAWYFNPGRGISEKVYVGKSYRFYIRCIKN